MQIEQEFNEIFDNLNLGLQLRVTQQLTNFGCDKERFTDLYKTIEYNMQNDMVENKENLEQEILK